MKYSALFFDLAAGLNETTDCTHSPNPDLEYTTEVLGVGRDESANVDDQLLLKYRLDWIKRKTSVIQDALYVIGRHWLVNHFFILAPHADC